jgi:phospholipid/cholesterol/gamma-HCH transport system substrate-binding protein
METKVNFAVVGAFVLILGAALIGGVLWLASGKTYRKAYDTYLVYMTESVSGLDLDSPVRYRGVDVGAVRRIELAPGDVERVKLTLAIAHGTPVKQDTVAVLRTQGLTGIGHIELSGGGRSSPALEASPGEEYPVIRTGPSLMVRLDAAVTALLANLNRSSERFNALLDEGNRRAIAETLANLEVVSRTLAARAAAIDSSVQNASRTMENAARLTAELPQLVERINRTADAFDRMADEGARAGVSATRALESAGAGARQFTNETLPGANALVAELRELTATLRRFSDQLERNPSMLLYGRPAAKPGPGE